jgi:hypothetical protein
LESAQNSLYFDIPIAQIVPNKIWHQVFDLKNYDRRGRGKWTQKYFLVFTSPHTFGWYSAEHLTMLYSFCKGEKKFLKKIGPPYFTRACKKTPTSILLN